MAKDGTRLISRSVVLYVEQTAGRDYNALMSCKRNEKDKGIGNWWTASNGKLFFYFCFIRYYCSHWTCMGGRDQLLLDGHQIFWRYETRHFPKLSPTRIITKKKRVGRYPFIKLLFSYPSLLFCAHRVGEFSDVGWFGRQAGAGKKEEKLMVMALFLFCLIKDNEI